MVKKEMDWPPMIATMMMCLAEITSCFVPDKHVGNLILGFLRHFLPAAPFKSI